MRGLIVLALLLTGCVNAARDPLVVLVCTIDGQETYRSAPSGDWYMQDGGGWVSQGYRHSYKQSYRESCRTEDVK